jgi:hypothetical protein
MTKMTPVTSLAMADRQLVTDFQTPAKINDLPKLIHNQQSLCLSEETSA